MCREVNRVQYRANTPKEDGGTTETKSEKGPNKRRRWTVVPFLGVESGARKTEETHVVGGPLV